MLVPWGELCEDNAEQSRFLEKLSEVAAADPLILDEVIRGVLHHEPAIRMQAADLVEKVTRVRPLFLMPYKRVLLGEFSRIAEIEVRWRMAILYSRVFWDEWEMQQVVSLLEEWIEAAQDEKIVIRSLQAFYILAMQTERIRPNLLKKLKNAVGHNNVAIRNLANDLMLSFPQ